MSKYCSICCKDLSKWKQLDFSRDIICDDCTDAKVNFVAMLEKEFTKEIRDFKNKSRKGKEIKEEPLGMIRNKEEYEFAYQLWKAKLEKKADQNEYKGEDVREARKNGGLSLESLSAYLDISKSYLCKMEKGQKPLSEKAIDFIKDGINFRKKTTKSLNKYCGTGK